MFVITRVEIVDSDNNDELFSSESSSDENNDINDIENSLFH